MGLARTFEELNVQLKKLRDTALALRMTVIEDKPPRSQLALVEDLGERVEELLGWLQDAMTAATESQLAIEPLLDTDRLRRALTMCQELINRATCCVSFEIASHERLTELTALGRRRGGEWSVWAPLVCKTLAECQRDCYDAYRALLSCWQDLAERTIGTAISVQSTNIVGVDRDKQQECASA